MMHQWSTNDISNGQPIMHQWSINGVLMVHQRCYYGASLAFVVLQKTTAQCPCLKASHTRTQVFSTGMHALVMQ